jgi:hypothetical protein
MDNITHEMRLAHWADQIRECHNSGMTVRAWCAANNIGEKKYFYWQRRVRKAVVPGLPLPVSIGCQNVPFVEIPLPTAAGSFGSADIVLRTCNCVFEIRNTASTALLELLLKAVSHAE